MKPAGLLPAMETGRVRAILGTHAALRPGTRLAWPEADPNALLPAPPLETALRALHEAEGEAAVRALAHDYAALWARTFPTLVRQLRGRPERALALFAEEVYPFLRGDRLAARLESFRPGHARILLAPGLPEPYVAGLLEGFVALSGAEASCIPAGAGAFQVGWRLGAAHRVARAAQDLASLRIPLLVAALLSAVLGAAIAHRLAGTLDAWRVAAVFVGAVAVQAAANAMHDLRAPHPAGPLGPARFPVRVLRRTAFAGYALAGTLGLWLAWSQPLVLAFAAAGLVLSLLFGRFRNAGWGPVLAGLTYGPLLTLGAVHAAAPGLAPAVRPELLLTLPTGLMAAAMLHLDDLADRPLDEAGGSRTLAVRLPRRRQAMVYALLVAAGVGLTLAAPVLFLDPAVAGSLPFWLLAAWLTLWAGAQAQLAGRRLDDPAGLAPVRFGALAMLAACSLATTLVAFGAP